MMEECDGYEEISSITSRPSALELITPCPTGHGQHRSLWCEVSEVKNSGILGQWFENVLFKSLKKIKIKMYL